ncbi:carbohydrate-binding protein [Paenibacillus alvei]|nr:carbohydrate-binding protein [Paenibacillus alvei]
MGMLNLQKIFTPLSVKVVPVVKCGCNYSTYVQGDIVSYNGVKYQAKWWTQNEYPDLKNGPNDVWTVLGPC